VHVLLQVKALRQLLIGRRYLGTSDNTAGVGELADSVDLCDNGMSVA